MAFIGVKTILLCCVVCFVRGSSGLLKDTRSLNKSSDIGRAFGYVLDQCDKRDDIVKCFQIQAGKLVSKALKISSLQIIDGLSITKKADAPNESRSGREIDLTAKDIEKLTPRTLGSYMWDRLKSFLQSREIQISIPKILAFGKRATAPIFESRNHKKKGDDKKYLAPLIATMVLKSAILKMAYHSIAVVAGKALLVGKIALIISAIIGLKKLVSSESHEKTTYEIVKHPNVQHSHTYSSSHGEDYGGHSGAESYHRSIGDDEMIMQDKIYQGWLPTNQHIQMKSSNNNINNNNNNNQNNNHNNNHNHN